MLMPVLARFKVPFSSLIENCGKRQICAIVSRCHDFLGRPLSFEGGAAGGGRCGADGIIMVDVRVQLEISQRGLGSVGWCGAVRFACTLLPILVRILNLASLLHLLSLCLYLRWRRRYWILSA